jgi:hypothetical protein
MEGLSTQEIAGAVATQEIEALDGDGDVVMTGGPPLLSNTWTHESSGTLVENVVHGETLVDDVFGEVIFERMTVQKAVVIMDGDEVPRTVGHLRRPEQATPAGAHGSGGAAGPPPPPQHVRGAAARCSMGRHHGSRTDGGARLRVGQLDYDLSSTSPAAVCNVGNFKS